MGDRVETALCTFKSSECYVYAPLPPATSYGHRAELWGNGDVEKGFLKVVHARVVIVEDDCFVRLEAADTGELFAECPLPGDGTPFTTCVEPVVDSSRYYVVRVVDREEPRKHAFVGIGFRQRTDSTDFSAALDDHRQYLRRRREALALRSDFEARAQLQDGGGGGDEGSGGSGGGGGAPDYSLKPGQTIRLDLSKSVKRSASSETGAAAAPSSRDSGDGASSAASAAASPTAFLPPKLQPPPPPPSSSGRSAAAAAAAAPLQRSVSDPQPGPPLTAPPLPAAAAGDCGVGGGTQLQGSAADDDGWGDFVG